jgi:hypothetical protein
VSETESETAREGEIERERERERQRETEREALLRDAGAPHSVQVTAPSPFPPAQWAVWEGFVIDIRWTLSGLRR